MPATLLTWSIGSVMDLKRRNFLQMTMIKLPK